MYISPMEEERILSVFASRCGDDIPYNMRHELWLLANRKKGTLPQEYRGLDFPDVCAKWGASWRCYAGYYVENCLKISYEGVEVRTEERGDAVVTIIETPVGTLRSVARKTVEGLSSLTVEYPVKTAEDIKTLEYVLDSVKVEFDLQAYERLRARVKGNGIVTLFFPRSPFQALILNYMGIPRAYKMLIKEKERVESLMEAIKRYNYKFYEVAAASPIKLLNLGENIDVRLTSPRFYKKYCLPYYQEVCDYLHRHGKYITIHVDGYAKPLLPLLSESGIDGVEALTPKPAGDVTLEDMEKGLREDIVIVDGIPYLLLLPHYPLKALGKFVEKIAEKFRGRLVLGISDEVPPPADPDRLKQVSKILQKIADK